MAEISAPSQPIMSLMPSETLGPQAASSNSDESPDVAKTADAELRAWEKLIREKCQNRCSNCGGDDRLRVMMIIPLEAGGKLVDSNGAMVCRTCELAAEAVRNGGVVEDRRPLNIWVSRSLYDNIQSSLKARNGFRSMGSLVRYLMSTYVRDEDRFDDLAQYQDAGTDVKINVWVDRDQYAVFKQLLDKRGTTVTDAVKSLIRMYEAEAEPVVRRRN